MKAIDYLRAGNDSLVCHSGNGQGFSVLEMIEAARRPGDPARLVASSQRARDVLGWVPQYG